MVLGVKAQRGTRVELEQRPVVVQTQDRGCTGTDVGHGIALTLSVIQEQLSLLVP